MTTLTSQQRGAVTSTARNILVVAGPGSGKTRIIIERVAHLASGGEHMGDMAVVTYTNAAARVIEERVNGIRDYSRLGFIGTLHAFCLKHMNAHGPWKNGVTVLDDDEADELLERSARDAGVRTTPTVMRVLKQTRLDWIAEQHMPETSPRIAVRQYYNEMARAGRFDYNSILLATWKMLSDGTQPRRAWSHLIVDEFQDSTWIDARIYEAVTAGSRFYVGDPMQAIFGFRGGDAREIERLEKDPKWERHELDLNHRSGQKICDAVTRLARAGRAASTLALKSVSDVEATVGSRAFQNEGTEALAIANMVMFERPGDVSVEEYAILTRTNAIATSIVAALEGYDIPVCRMVVAETPEDWEHAMSALNYLSRPTSIKAVESFVLSTLKSGAPGMVLLAEPTGRTEYTSSIQTKIPITGDADKMEHELLELAVSEESIAIIKARFDELPDTASLADLHASLKLDKTQKKLEGEGVYVGTIHSAKGMEFDTVVLAGFEDEVIPGARKKADVDEERRIAYVGMTRAKRRLMITWSRWRQETWGAPAVHTASRFIAEAGL